MQDPDDPPFVRLGVRDTGTGIPHEIMDKVLEPFFATKPVGKGSGLGLSMVFGFAKQSGGDLAIESELGRGTSFSLSLPIASAADAASAMDLLCGPTRYSTLFSDVMLTGVMTGAALADYVSEKWPYMRTILTSGFDPSAGRIGKAAPPFLAQAVPHQGPLRSPRRSPLAQPHRAVSCDAL